MKFCTIFIVLISFGYLNAMEEISSIVKGTVVLNIEPRRKMTWSARLADGQAVNASACYKSKKTRNTREEDLFKAYYSGYISSKRLKAEDAEKWVKALIKVSMQK